MRYDVDQILLDMEKDMEIKDRTVLITGGGSGIGKGLAEVFYRFGGQVIVTGRKEEPLRAMCEKRPGMKYFVMDVANPDSVRKAAEHIRTEHPKLDCLVNNAGIQRHYDFTGETLPSLEDLCREVDTNLKGLIWMTTAFLPILKANAPATLINVSSGLSYVPIAQMPVYSATKAAVHSFTMSLRHQLRNSGVRVHELMPPPVETSLDSDRKLPDGSSELSVAGFVDATLTALLADDDEIAIGTAELLRAGAQSDLQKAFARINP